MKSDEIETRIKTELRKHRPMMGEEKTIKIASIKLSHDFRQSLEDFAKEIMVRRKSLKLADEGEIDDVFEARDFGFNQAIDKIQSNISKALNKIK